MADKNKSSNIDLLDVSVELQFLCAKMKKYRNELVAKHSMIDWENLPVEGLRGQTDNVIQMLEKDGANLAALSEQLLDKLSYDDNITD